MFQSVALLILLSSLMIIEIQSFRQQSLLSQMIPSSSMKRRSAPLSSFSVAAADITQGISSDAVTATVLPVKADLLNQGMLLADNGIAPTAVGFLFIAIAIMVSLQYLSELHYCTILAINHSISGA